jgi:hypothetical protein
MAGYRQGCPICERPDAERMPPAELRDTFRVVCSSCGKFEVQVLLPKLVWDRLGEADQALLRTGLPAYIHHRNKQGSEPRLSAQNWQAYAREGCRLLARAP